MPATMTVKQLRNVLKHMPENAEVKMQISLRGTSSRFLVRDVEQSPSGEVVLKHA